MATRTLEFSRAKLSVIPTPSERTYYKDSVTKALYLAVLPSSTKAFELYRKVNGKPTRIGLGHFDPALPESRTIPKDTDPLSLVGNAASLNVGMARLMASALNAKLDMGINPAELKRSTRKAKLAEPTLQEAFSQYEKEYLIPQGKRTTSDLRSLFDRNLGYVAPGQKKVHGKERTKSKFGVDWSKRQLSEISTEEVRRLHNNLKEGGSVYTANRVFELLRAIYNKMTEWKLYSGENPCSGVQKFKETSRDRFITGDELPKFFTALADVTNENFKDFILLSLFTGARRENVLGMRWNDINYDASLWTIPGNVSKNGAPQFISLSDIALDLLADRKARVGTGAAYVFPSTGKSGYMSAPKKQWATFLNQAGLSNLHFHDLRRSLGSWAAMTGASLHTIGAALGHKSTEATKVYARLQGDVVKSALDIAATVIMTKGGYSSPSAESEGKNNGNGS